MMSFFLNPWVMVAGAVLAVSPIIIHLINRIRFRRVEWAAMEFLLKAQKKMRRKKILEQLLLLLLRILLVLLAGFLLARFLGDDPTQGKETRPVLHVVILDDSPSMLDNSGEPAGGKDAFNRGKAIIVEKILPAATKASTDQALRLIRLSDQKDIVNTSTDPNKAPAVIDAQLIESVKKTLASEKTSPVHAGLVPGLQKAKEHIAKLPKKEETKIAKVVHVVSDMRSADWYRDSAAITKEIEDLAKDDVTVHLIDVAAPNRKPDRKTPAYSDNVAIVDFKPRNRVAALDKEIEFEVRVKNYGSTDLKNVRVEFFLNGAPNWITSKGFDLLPANQERTEVILVTFSTNQDATVATREKPFDRFNVLTARLANTGADAIAADNVRHAVVEVREKLSVLMVTRPPADDKPADKDGDSFYLRRLFEIKFSGIDVVYAERDALDKMDLREFSSVYLVNVPELSESQAANLERYAREGGGVGVFLGPNVASEPYNARLYRKGDGFLPFPLPPDATPPLTLEQKNKRSLFGGSVLTKRVLIREAAARSHPALAGIYQAGAAAADKDTATKVEASFMLVGIDQHWPVARIGRWREDRTIQELYCLPNETAISEYQGRVEKLVEAVKGKYGEPKFEKYRPTVDAVMAKLRETAADPSNPPLSDLAHHLDKLLADQATEGEASDALLREFWGNPELAPAKATAQSLRDSAKFGDPLYVARRFGNGRVAVLTIGVGAPWTDWPSGPGVAGWVAVMTELQKYLAGGGSEENRVIGTPLVTSYEATRYKPEVKWSFVTYDPLGADKGAQKLTPVVDPPAGQPPKAQGLDLADRALRLNFTDTRRPGVYFFELTRLKRDGDPVNAPSQKPEYVAAVFNYDADNESDLKRANSDDLKTVAKGAEDVHSPDDDSWLGILEQKPTDLSSGRWVYLLVLLVLIFEQAMAVRLSYHGRPDDLSAFAPSAAAAMGGRTAAPAAAEAAADRPAAAREE